MGLLQKSTAKQGVAVVYLPEGISRNSFHLPEDFAEWKVVDNSDRMEAEFALTLPCEWFVTVITHDRFNEMYLEMLVWSEQYPTVLKVVLQDGLSPHQVALLADITHRVLPLSLSGEEMVAELEQCRRSEQILSQHRVKDMVDSIERLPSLPDVYVQLNNVLHDPDSDLQDVANVLVQDMAMTAKVLQMVNSSLFGIERKITRIEEAVAYLGIRQIRDLVLTDRLFEQYPQDPAWSSFSFAHVRDRSMLVARLAQQVCRSVKAPQEVIDKAFVGALLQDFGMLIFATHDAEGYQKIMQQATNMGQPLYALEKLRLGVTHTEAGAYLLRQWKLPSEVIETVMFHHFPNSSHINRFSPLTAVHIADALLPDVSNALECRIASRLSMPYIERLGLQNMLTRWHIMAKQTADRAGLVLH